MLAKCLHCNRQNTGGAEIVSALQARLGRRILSTTERERRDSAYSLRSPSNRACGNSRDGTSDSRLSRTIIFGI